MTFRFINFECSAFAFCSRGKTSKSMTTYCYAVTRQMSSKLYRAYRRAFSPIKLHIRSMKAWCVPKPCKDCFLFNHKIVFFRLQIHNGPPHDSNYGYSYAKRLIDITNRAYFDKHQRMFTSIVPCNIYGPNDNFHETESHVIPGMIQRMYKIIHDDSNATPEEERIFHVYGTGKPLRQFIYSHDLARLAIWVLRDYESVEPIILSGKWAWNQR